MKTTLFALLMTFSFGHAGDIFSTKDHIKARGIDMSFTLPEGLRKMDDDEFRIQGWFTKVNGMSVFIVLSMDKHNMHTNEEKMEAIKKHERSGHGQVLQAMRRKVGNEPAVITESSHESTNSEGRRVEYQSLEMVLFPGDTTIKILCQVAQADYGGEPLKESISAVRPMFLKMLDSVELH